MSPDALFAAAEARQIATLSPHAQRNIYGIGMRQLTQKEAANLTNRQDPGKRYRQMRNERDDKRCPVCGVRIAYTSKTCVRHRPHIFSNGRRKASFL